MKVTLPYFSPAPSTTTPGMVGQLCSIETDTGRVEGIVQIDEAALDAYVTERAIGVLRSFGVRKRIRDLGALPNDDALRDWLGLAPRRRA